MHLKLPALGTEVWFASDQGTQEAVLHEARAWPRLLKTPQWMADEGDRLALPEPRTVGGVVEALDGHVVGWHPRAER